MGHKLTVEGGTTQILIKDFGKEPLQTLLQVYDSIKATDEKLYGTLLYEGKIMKTPNGETSMKGRGLSAQAGLPFVKILSGLYALQKKGFLTKREVEKIEACTFRRIVARSPFRPEAIGLRRDSSGNRALNYLIYVLYKNITRALHQGPFDRVGEFLSEQGIAGAATCNGSALSKRYRGLVPVDLESWYTTIYKPASEKFPPPLPEWESLLHLHQSPIRHISQKKS